MKYFFLDTNLYLFSTFMHKPDYSQNFIQVVEKMMKANPDFQLLLPEIVELEYARLKNDLGDKIRSDNKKLLKDLEQNKNYGEGFDALKKELIETHKNYNTLIEKNIELAERQIEQLFESAFSIRIPIKNKHLLNAYKRALLRKKPFSINNPRGNIIGHNADCVIIEGLIDFLNDKTDCSLYICSDNHKDFAIYDNTKKTHIIHPQIESDFNTEVIYVKDVPNYFKNKFKIKVPREFADNFSSSFMSWFSDNKNILSPAASMFLFSISPLLGTASLILPKLLSKLGNTNLTALEKNKLRLKINEELTNGELSEAELELLLKNFNISLSNDDNSTNSEID